MEERAGAHLLLRAELLLLVLVLPAAELLLVGALLLALRVLRHRRRRDQREANCSHSLFLRAAKQRINWMRPRSPQRP